MTKSLLIEKLMNNCHINYSYAYSLINDLEHRGLLESLEKDIDKFDDFIDFFDIYYK